MIRTNVLSSLVLFFLAPGVFAQIEINWEQERAVSIYFESSDVSEDRDLRVSMKGVETAIIGDWTSWNQGLKFTPIVPFSPGISYEIKSGETILGTFAIDHKSMSKTRVINLYPTTDTVPENLLKIHIAFSGSMGEQLSERFISVTNDLGDTLEKIFLPLQPELWNAKRDILTLWLDPGRIKRALGPNQTLGSPLKASQSYQINISAAWKDQNGYQMQHAFTKKYIAKEATRTKPDPHTWKINTPKPYSRDTLRIAFERPMDFVLSRECISVYRDNLIDGEVNLQDDQRIWLFTPDEYWAPGSYQIKIESRMEDLAGNNLQRLFDEEISEQKQAQESQLDHRLEFQIY